MKGFLILILVSVALSHSKGYKTGIFRSANSLDRYTDKYTNKDNVKKMKDDYDAKEAKSKARAILRARESEERWDYYGKKNDAMGQGFHIDPVLNRMLNRRRAESASSLESDSRSSSRELRDWKEEWKEMWAKQKEKAMNATDPGGDKVVFVAARPWNVPCGDPTEHDMPWGSCVLPAECDGEFRIYRGDYFCGRTQFICCSLAFTSYDAYQGLDGSLDQSSMATDSVERKNKKYKAKKNKKKSSRDKKRRKRMREERKRKIRRTIARIVKEVRKILNKAYRNGTKVRKRKTKKMKKFIRFLKRQYRMDRNSAKDIHEHNLWQIDEDLLKKLYEIKDVNRDFMTNETFRHVIMKQKMNYQAARMLVEAYPELREYVVKDATRSGKFAERRSLAARRPRRRYLDYDVEYGLLYS